MSFRPAVTKLRPRPSQREIKAVEQLLNEASKPLVIAGGGVKSSKAEGSLVAFAEKYELPVMVSFRRHDSFPNNHRLYAGHLGLGTSIETLQTVNEADLIIAVGTRLSEVTTQDYSIPTPEQQLIHLDIAEASIGQVFAPTVGVLADAKQGLEALLEIKVDQAWYNWTKACHRAYQKSSSPSANDFHQQLIAVLRKRLPENAILSNDAGNFAGWLHSFYPFPVQNTYIGPTSGAMGYGMPAALGAKLAQLTVQSCPCLETAVL